MLICLLTAFQHTIEKHFNFVGAVPPDPLPTAQGTLSPVIPLAYGIQVCVRAYGTIAYI
jgi:hypothetical protein